MIMVLNNGPHGFSSYSYCFSICTEMSLNQFLTGSHNHAAKHVHVECDVSTLVVLWGFLWQFCLLIRSAYS